MWFSRLDQPCARVLCRFAKAQPALRAIITLMDYVNGIAHSV